ncbi:MAG: hypothetical protein NZ899_07670 [Thermoguttaceae bacterium]|nr:hypothetical protein [Thermoguttaceae bacterium]
MATRWMFTAWFGALVLAIVPVGPVAGQKAEVMIDLADRLGPLEIGRIALGQGGLSEQPMFESRIPELRALRPKMIRLFIQEYFNLLPEPGKYDFAKLDRVVDVIRATGATPLMCICFKPPVLFPEINQDIVERNDYAAWEELIRQLVSHYRKRGDGIRYWEVMNEPDIGEWGGCPYRFQPDSYCRFYQHTAKAILEADPEAKVGGPALANVRSPILPALLRLAQAGEAPLHFVSWHVYSSDPGAIRRTIDYVRELLGQFPGLQVELVLDEWNMDLFNPPLDARFQPCFIVEVAWQMKEARLDWSCYFHIRDWHVEQETFRRFMSPEGAAFMARWWNRMPQFDGLFDYQNRVRPAYFAFKLLSRLQGERLRLESNHPAVHGFATHDPEMRMYNLLVWNFSDATVPAIIRLKNLPAKLRARHITLDAAAPCDDENVRLRPEPFFQIDPGSAELNVELGPYAVHYWSLE